MILSRLFIWLALALGSVTLLSCSSTDDAQRDFEREAFRTPSGITETDASGNIISSDPDDWRVGPLFAGFVEVQQPAYPNPTTGQIVTIEMLITGLGAVNGLDVLTLDDRNFFKRLFFDERRPLPVGFTQIIINPVQFAPGGSGTISGARGLHRVFVFDGRENLITYGDIRVD
ncbi:MAG: hypothetical protein LAT75_06990 [Candidatus Cyclonatronum sp.]|uniref:hypothetical protein n=1 Tax=Cyclonatronum sp. TaxID=3024185 RepID=UPI0025BC547A|nr:hypothetical protein [Cyclonatronum sp.]MCC5932927.1 hypothetical protein [Balneolales bacterium]MCH8486594.1 hypothetical protein [Cyclonatronum sp.]